ncbi:aryl-alcohol oxidase precursor [Armillaria nabsnona]|nr:aryl-alcohol oxidase precursor [Armillaria nabsnona]
MLSSRLWVLLLPAVCSAVIHESIADFPIFDFDYIIVGVPFLCEQAMPNTFLDWNFTTTPQPGFDGRSVPYSRGFGLGGCGTVNYMAYTRGSSEDYDRYEHVTGDEGWGWKEIQPCIKKNERLVAPADRHNTTGQFEPNVHGFEDVNSVSLPGVPRTIDQRIIQATQELLDDFPFNLDYNSGYHLGIGWMQTTVGNGTRNSSETSYLGPGYIDRENLHVLVHSHVTRNLVANDTVQHHKMRFDTVEFTQDAGTKSFSQQDPSERLNSGIGDADELTAMGITPIVHIPDSGKNLTDYPLLGLSWFVNDSNTMENVYWWNATFQEEALVEWQANRTGYIASTSTNHLGFLRVAEGMLEEVPCAGKKTGHYELIFSAGTSRSNSTDLLSPPLINPGFFSHPQDLTVMRHAVAGARRFLSAPVWDDYVLGMFTNITDLEGSVRNEAKTTPHPVGTARVVDPDLKLKKAAGVRVVDASILPFVPAGHTQAAVYAIADRAADLIKESC